MKKILLIFITIFFVNAAEIEKWSIVGLSGTAYKIDVLNESEKGLFVAAYQVWRHLNFTRSEKGDTIIAKSGKNELRLVKNSAQYSVNGKIKTLDYPIIYKDGVNYCDINSFCTAMNLLSGLYFNADSSEKKISVSRTKDVKNVDVKDIKDVNTFIEEIEDDKVFGVVVIDPGHGGKDPGAIGPGGGSEKDAVLPISLEIKKYLSKYSGVKIYLTRETDTFIPLSERTEFANGKNADLFVSVHANASEKSVNVGGYKMYFLSEAKNESDEWTARLENSVLKLEGESKMSGLESVLFSLANSEFIKESQDFSIMLEKSFGKNMKDIQRLHTGVGQANFYVLNGASMPAVLVETAFISNPKEEKLLADKKFQNETAESIGAAIVDFLKKYGGGL